MIRLLEPVRVSFALCLLCCLAASANAQEVVRFSQQPTEVGDRVVQQVEVELSLKTTVTQSQQIAHESEATIHRRQQRVLRVLEVADGQARRAEATFPISQERSPENENAEKMVPQPVEGKTYLVERRGETLMVRDSAGNLPPKQEFEIVYEALKSFGKPNPLAKYLLGREVRVGETLALPRSLAEELLGLGDAVGEVREMTLRLEGTQLIDEQPCAVFTSSIKAIDHGSNAQQLNVSGRMAVEVQTCRTVAAEVGGPLSMRTTHATAGGTFQQQIDGGLRVALRSRYGEVK